jgi:hypothetical protein
MIDELGLDRTQAGAMLEMFRVRNLAATASGGTSGVRARARRLVDEHCADIGSDARTALADALTFDAIRKRCPLETSQQRTVAQLLQQVESHFAGLERELTEEGVGREHARALVLEGKTTLFDDALAGSNDLLRTAVKTKAPDARSAAGAAAATRTLLDKLTVRVRDNKAGNVTTPLHAVPLSLAASGNLEHQSMHADVY